MYYIDEANHKATIRKVHMFYLKIMAVLIILLGASLYIPFQYKLELIALQPDSRLAHLIKGDLLLAKARPLSTMGGGITGAETGLHDLREEARLRLLSHLEEPDPALLPKQML